MLRAYIVFLCILFGGSVKIDGVLFFQHQSGKDGVLLMLEQILKTPQAYEQRFNILIFVQIFVYGIPVVIFLNLVMACVLFFQESSSDKNEKESGESNGGNYVLQNPQNESPTIPNLNQEEQARQQAHTSLYHEEPPSYHEAVLMSVQSTSYNDTTVINIQSTEGASNVLTGESNSMMGESNPMTRESNYTENGLKPGLEAYSIPSYGNGRETSVLRKRSSVTGPCSNPSSDNRRGSKTATGEPNPVTAAPKRKLGASSIQSHAKTTTEEPNPVVRAPSIQSHTTPETSVLRKRSSVTGKSNSVLVASNPTLAASSL